MKPLGTVMGGVAGYEAGKYTRKVMRINAINAERDTSMQAAQVRDAARIHMGRQVGSQATSGLQIGSGSALDALRESAINAELDMMMTRRKGKSQANAATVQGEQAFAEGYNAFTGSLVKGAGEVMEMAANYASAGQPA